MSIISLTQAQITGSYTPVFGYLPGTYDNVTADVSNYTIINNFLFLNYTISFDNSSGGASNVFVTITLPENLKLISNFTSGVWSATNNYADLVGVNIIDNGSDKILLQFVETAVTLNYTLQFTIMCKLG